MAALQCELCGGKLVGKPGGIFECDSCGMEYSTEWAKAKIQEIKGTVKVEGTVQVEGTVKVEGGVNIESLLKRGQLALEDQQWEKATQYFDDALNLDAECAEAYLGKFFARNKVSDLEKLFEKANNPCNTEKMVGALKTDSDLQKARRFSTIQETAQFLNRIDELQNLAQSQKEKNDELRSAMSKRIASVRGVICAGRWHTAGLRTDGSVVAKGCNTSGQCNVSRWSNIVAITAGMSHTVGLRADGTVVATGDNDEGQCNVSNWSNIVAIAAGVTHTVGLQADGTVVATGDNEDGACDVSDWRSIVSIAAGESYTVGLKADGTAVSVGALWREDLSGHNIVAIDARGLNIIGLQADGTVVITGRWRDVSAWHDIVAIAVGESHAVGLRADGTVVVAGSNEYGACNVSDWNNIVAIVAGEYHTVGLRADGTVMAVGTNRDGQCNTSDWKLFNSLETIEQEREESAARKAEEARLEADRKAEEVRLEAERKAEKARLEAERKAKRAAELNAEKSALCTKLSNLKGLFTGKRRKEIEARLEAIEHELKGL